MTLPLGLQAMRDSGVAWCNEKRFAALLDLIETLAGALNLTDKQLSNVIRDDAVHTWPDTARIQRSVSTARTALDKYREFK